MVSRGMFAIILHRFDVGKQKKGYQEVTV
jgi:hypothetical protein